MSKKSTVRQKSVGPISKGYGNVSKDPALSTRPTLSSKLSGVGEVKNTARLIFLGLLLVLATRTRNGTA